jgi:hypothetical protein
VKLEQVLRTIDGKPISKKIDLDLQVDAAFGADLMSDVLMCAQEGTLLLTGIINPQVVRTAEMVSSQAIVFVRCKIPLPETIALAEEKGIYLMACKYSMFETCGRLFAAGMDTCEIPEPSLQQWRKMFDNK